MRENLEAASRVTSRCLGHFRYRRFPNKYRASVSKGGDLPRLDLRIAAHVVDVTNLAVGAKLSEFEFVTLCAHAEADEWCGVIGRRSSDYRRSLWGNPPVKFVVHLKVAGRGYSLDLAVLFDYFLETVGVYVDPSSSASSGAIHPVAFAVAQAIALTRTLSIDRICCDESGGKGKEKSGRDGGYAHIRWYVIG